MALSEDIHLAVYQKHLQAGNLARLLALAEAEARQGRTRSAREFLKEFMRDRTVQV